MYVFSSLPFYAIFIQGVVVLQTCTNIDLLLYSCKALCDAGFVASVAPACLMFHVVTACSVVSFVKSLPGRFSEYRMSIICAVAYTLRSRSFTFADRHHYAV